ncbi:MAG TPA: hypothetical protein VGK59_08465 [Ohtaekwangia sp.]
MKRISKERKRSGGHVQEIESPMHFQGKLRDDLIDRLIHIRQELLDFIQVCRKRL